MKLTIDEKEYLEITWANNKEKFKDERFDEKIKISLIFYLIETDRFEELYNKKIDYSIDSSKEVYLPPENIDTLLKDLNNNYNYEYEEAISRDGPQEIGKIPSPQKLIDLFLHEFKEEKPYSLSFHN